MKLTVVLLAGVVVSACSVATPTSPDYRPPLATPPPQPSNNLVALWGIVVTPSGVCIEGATVEVVGGPVLLGQKATQTTPCDLTRFSGGFMFDEAVPAAIEMTLRASAPGYVSQEQTVETGSEGIITFSLVPTGL